MRPLASPSAPRYVPNDRKFWLKLKPDYLTNNDSVDLVVLGASLGNGNKSGLLEI